MPQAPPPPKVPRHNYTGPSTPAEEAARQAEPGVLSPDEKVRLAHEASREEDA
jgi:hypothetical protein